MKLLMITRKIDKGDSLAGFIYNWVKKLGAEVDRLIVICQERGDSSGLPKNVEIYSLGKEKGKSKLSQLIRFKLLLFKHIRRVDGVLAHMMPIYSIVAGPFCFIFRKKLIQWYMHRSVDLKLRLTKLFASEYVTASKLSFRMKTRKKVNIVGHGIDTEMFSVKSNVKSSNFRIITVGRISPSKDYESMIKAVYDLRAKGAENISLDIIGGAGLSRQEMYLDTLKDMVRNMNLEDEVSFLGPIANSDTPKYLHESDLFINLSDTGSLDKAVLEAMATGTIVLTSNEAFRGIVPSELMVRKDRPDELASKIKYVENMDEDRRKELSAELRNIVVSDHNLDKLARKIVKLF